jgi:hypothetical protein
VHCFGALFSFLSSGQSATPRGLFRHRATSRLASGGLLTVATCSLSLALTVPAGALTPAFLSHFNRSTTVQTTVPANGDQNPYGIVGVPETVGHLVRGNTW